ncbi:anthranilate synthase component I [Bacillus horti]
MLESIEGGEKWARYSFIGNDPDFIFTVKQGKAVLTHFYPERKVEEVDGEPLAILKQLLKTYQVPQLDGVPRFSGGAVGFIGYDAIQLVESLPEHVIQDGFTDDIRLLFCSEVIAFDHLQQEIIFISHLQLQDPLSSEQVTQHYHRACQRLLEKINSVLKQDEAETLDFFQLPQHKSEVDWSQVQSNMGKEDYLRAIDQIKEYIRAGDVFQTVFSQRFAVELKTDPFNVYRVLRTVNPSPYLYYLDLGDDMILVGSSPERLVQVEGRRIETNPIAGTRKRGRTMEEDQQLEKELLQDEKERAEHHMLVDLGRNDVGKVAKYGTVSLPKLMEIDRFSHVMHIVSTVEGELREDVDAVDALFSCFPAGTVSGAPKIRAMEIIAELEQYARKAYAGAIGYFSYTGNLDHCIAIRTMVVKEGIAYVQAGGGIVADSVPELEWEETRSKASAMLVAIQLAEQLFEQKKQEVRSYA